MTVNYIPKDHQHVIPYLVVEEIEPILDFVKQTFDAKETECIKGPGGVLMHAQVQIADSVVMFGRAREQFQPMPACIYVYVKDTDAAFQKALAAGSTSVMEPQDQFYGDRNAGVKDVAGNMWWIGTHLEDVSTEELQKRADAMGDQH